MTTPEPCLVPSLDMSTTCQLRKGHFGLHLSNASDYRWGIKTWDDDQERLRPHWVEYFLGIAAAVSERADCTRRKVGAVIVDKDNRIVATGYNGGPSKGLSCLAGECPRGRATIEEIPSFEQGNSNYSDCIAIHAEVNALLYADRSRIEGGTMYLTCAPCGECTKILRNSGLYQVRWPGESGRMTL